MNLENEPASAKLAALPNWQDTTVTSEVQNAMVHGRDWCRLDASVLTLDVTGYDPGTGTVDPRYYELMTQREKPWQSTEACRRRAPVC